VQKTKGEKRDLCARFEVRPEELNNFIETWKERLAKDVKARANA
jgi:hypothetical protein